jgi:site-specific DNA-methyltransferase (adenine-specific)
MEPICLARKPLAKRASDAKGVKTKRGTVAANVLELGVGALNIDECRISYENDVPDPATNPLYRKQHGGYANTSSADINPSSYRVRDEPGERNPHSAGRWPATLIHDGSDEVLDLFPNTGEGAFPKARGKSIFGAFGGQRDLVPRKTDRGSAARYFYCAKASTAERNGSLHPCVKPVALMRHLIRLITRPGGLVLDPFAGTGTTGVAARLEGRDFILIEKDPMYFDDIRNRLSSNK